MVQYVVVGEHTLGIVRPEWPLSAEVIAGLIIKGGHDWKNGGIGIFGAAVRRATLADFEVFRVHAPPGYA